VTLLRIRTVKSVGRKKYRNGSLASYLEVCLDSFRYLYFEFSAAFLLTKKKIYIEFVWKNKNEYSTTLMYNLRYGEAWRLSAADRHCNLYYHLSQRFKGILKLVSISDVIHLLHVEFGQQYLVFKSVLHNQQ